jgi:hypothetical protein
MRIVGLIAEGRLFVAGEAACDAMTSDREVQRFLPDQKIAERIQFCHGPLESTSRATLNSACLRR